MFGVALERRGKNLAHLQVQIETFIFNSVPRCEGLVCVQRTASPSLYRVPRTGGNKEAAFDKH